MTGRVLSIRGVGRRFVTDGTVPAALSGIDLSCPEGSFTALVGPSGCGKSTLLRLVAGLDHPDEGEIRFGNAGASWLTPDELRRKGALGMAFQDAALMPWRDVRANIALPLQVLRRDWRKDSQQIEALLALVGLEAMGGARPAQLSGGMRQRVALARALVTHPEILLLDEPFGALDFVLRREMVRELQRLWLESGATAVMVTHGIDEAVFLADRVVIMARGPGRIAAVVEADIPRPRPASFFLDPAFHALCDRVERLLADAS
ncbi:ABC transporter ATP-binding protein [Acidomonas methanolica]|uniref:ABC transporter ATP-binding protein n=1 Tax=Acidomonas methanolica TaxID=437 RepID=UPI00211A7FA5